MKYTNCALLLMLSVTIGCTFIPQQEKDLIVVDVTQSYDTKKELILQDFMDVEYIPLETNDEFVNQGWVQAIGENTILVANYTNDGTLYVYDRSGKALRKINRKGQGAEEYTGILTLALDEENGEIFINNHYSKSILVYDLYGNFKRRISYKDGLNDLFYTNIYNYDNQNLLCCSDVGDDAPFVLISKTNGSVVAEIPILSDNKKRMMLMKETDSKGGKRGVSPRLHRKVLVLNDQHLVCEVSSDTIFSLSSDLRITPFIVRTPAINTMDPHTCLTITLASDRYIFMETIKVEYDWDKERGFPRSFMVYDAEEKVLSGYTVYNGDYSTKKELYMNCLVPGNKTVESTLMLPAHELVEAYNNGELMGQLKEIASTLNEESNPVIMLIKHKLK